MGDRIEVLKIVREHYVKYSNKRENRKQGQFSRKIIWPPLIQEETENLNRPKTLNKLEL